MIVNFKEKDKIKTNVVYMINLYTAPYGKKFVYIGITKRRLQARVNEHLYYNTKSPVYQFIQNNNIKEIEIEILHECEYEQLLESVESYNIGKYFLKHGTQNNKKNRLLNLDLKGFQKMTLAKIEKCCNALEFSLI